MQELKLGESAIVSVRVINKVKGDSAKGTNLQIQVSEQINETNILGKLLPNDSRIIKNKAQSAWTPIETEVFFKYFGNRISEEDTNIIKGLSNSSGLKAAEMVENKHFRQVFIHNPMLDGERLRVQIIETTVKPNEQTQAKINPQTLVTVTHQGKPVYRIASVQYRPVNVFLPNDRVETVVQPPIVPNPNVNVMSQATA